MAGNARFRCIRNEVQRIGAAGVFRQRVVVEIRNPAFIQHDVFENRAETIGRGVDFRLGLGRKLAWLSRGLARVILGTVAVRDPVLVIEACKRFPGQVAVGIDAKGGKVAVEGWAEASELGIIELAKRFEGAGVAAIIYTDIDRDGILAGINWASTLELADAVSIPVIASGGLASIDDIKRMLQPDAAKLEGAISGRALYDGRIDPTEALDLIKAAKEVRA